MNRSFYIKLMSDLTYIKSVASIHESELFFEVSIYNNKLYDVSISNHNIWSHVIGISEDFYLKHIDLYPFAIRYIPNPTEKMLSDSEKRIREIMSHY